MTWSSSQVSRARKGGRKGGTGNGNNESFVAVLRRIFFSSFFSLLFPVLFFVCAYECVCFLHFCVWVLSLCRVFRGKRKAAGTRPAIGGATGAVVLCILMYRGVSRYTL